MRIISYLILLLLLTTTNVNALESYVDINQLSLKNKFDGLKAEPTSYQLRYGVNLNANLGLEVYYGGYMAGDNYSPTFVTDVKELTGFSFLGIFPVSSELSLIVKAGFGAMTHEANDGDEADDIGVTSGLGVNFKVNQVIGINIEYIRLPKVETGIGNIDTKAYLIGMRVNL